MKDHPLTPMRDSNLLRLLAPQVTRPVGLIDRLTVAQGVGAVRAALNARRKDGVAHVVMDAVADADLHVIAEACCDMPLMTGGSAVAMPLPDLMRAQGIVPEDAPRAETPSVDIGTLVVSGSCSAMTNRQVAAYIAAGHPSYRLDPLVIAEHGAADTLRWLAAQDPAHAPLIYATAQPEQVKAAQSVLGTAQAGHMIEQTLSQCAVAARDAGTRRFVVAGGETSGAVTQALGVDSLSIGPEIAPGVPWTFAQSNGHFIALTLKSGNFGDEAFFTDAQAKLSAA